MIKISKQNNSLIVEGIDNVFYPNNGDNSYPLNSLIVVTDNSDMATFRSVATNDVLFSGLIQNITINEEAVTKDTIIQKFDAVSNSSTGGGGGTVDAYTKEEADNKFASKDELTTVETSLGNKQDTLVSGTNIKTVNSQSILGEGNLEVSGVSEEQAQEIAKIPTLETELAQKANVSDVPTVQTGRRGTKKNYVYSDADTSYNNDKVLSSCYFSKTSSKRLDFNLKYWGDELYRLQLPIPLATPSTAGIMSGNDKTKLDSIPETIPSQSEIDGIAANVSALQTAMDGKQPTLVSGTNIKTINNQSILGEGNLEITGGEVDLTNYYTKTEADGKFASKDELTAVETSLGNKQDTLVSGTNIKTINNQSILGEGNITIEGGGIDLSNYYNKTEVDTKLDTKQNTLVSGTNIKTVNSQSILGEGNIEVTIPDATTATSGAMSAADKTKLDSISNEWTGTQSEYDALTTKDNNTIYYVTE